MQIALSVRGLNKTYHAGARSRAIAIPALRDVSVDVGAGEIVGLVGRPGAGKSTLLLCLAGLLKPDGGTINWFGEQVTGTTSRQDSLTPHSAPATTPSHGARSTEYYATLHDLSTANRVVQVEAAMREVCLHIHATRRVSTLSPSLVQRLGLAQSLIGSPRAILLDETLSGEGLLFDPDIVSVLTRLTRRGITIILAAPNPVELHRIAARIINIVEGRVVRLKVRAQ